MNKYLKIILIAVLAVGMALSFSACDKSGGSTGETGIKVKKIDGVYTVYSYVAKDNETELTIDKYTDSKGEEHEIGRIKAGAFAGSNLTKITVASTVETIDGGAFKNMTALTSLSLPFIGETATAVNEKKCFGYLFGTESYTEGSAVTQYYNSATSNVYYIPSTLRSVEITPSSDYSIPDYAFNGNLLIDTVTYNDNVIKIGNNAFEGCSYLKDFVVSKNIVAIGNNAFKSCLNLKNETTIFESRTATDLLSIGDSAFQGTKMANITLPEGVNSIGNYCFASITDSSALTIATDGESKLVTVTLPSTLTEIGQYAFYKCVNLTAAYVGAGETVVGNGAFLYCDKLNYFGAKTNEQNLTLDFSLVKEVKGMAFAYCEKITTVINSGSTILADSYKEGTSIPLA